MDIRYAFRSMARRPLFTATVVIVVALGIGPNVAIFTLFDSLLVRPLPYREPDRLVELVDVYEGATSGVGQSEFRDWRASADAFENIALAERTDAAIPTDDQPFTDRVPGTRVTASFFDVLGVPALIGRTFVDGEDEPGQADVVVLAHALWRERFGGRTDIIGETIPLDYEPYTVVGVLPAGFYWVGAPEAGFFRPLGYRSSGRGQHQYVAVGRLRAGATIAAAQAQLDVLAERAALQYPDAQGWTTRARPLDDAQARDARPALLLLAAAVGLVQLLVCANIAGLMLVRVTARAGDTAVRAALGARSGRLVRELVVEYGLLGLFGAGFGLLLAHELLRAYAALSPLGYAPATGFVVDARVVVFSLLLTVVSIALFIIAPARRAVHGDFLQDLNRRSGVAPQRSLLSTVIVFEIGVAAALLVSTGLLITSLSQLVHEDLGFQHAALLTMEVLPPPDRDTQPLRNAFVGGLLEQIAAVDPVESVAATSALPTSSVSTGVGFEIENRPLPEEWRQQSAQWCVVTPGYFRTLGIALLRGRDLRGTDNRATPGVVIVSESLARRHWPDQDPIGQRIRFAGNEPWLTVVGIVADTRYGGPGSSPSPTVYVPYAQATSWPWKMFVIVRVNDSRPAAVIAALRSALGRSDAGVPLTGLSLMDDRIAGTLSVERSVAAALSAFSLLAVVLAAVGLYGVVAQAVASRTMEMGMRRALGATRRQLLGMVLARALTLTAAGIAWGLLLAAAGTRIVEALLYDVDPLDPAVFTTVALLLALVALAASLVPALRAASVDPLEALRSS